MANHLGTETLNEVQAETALNVIIPENFLAKALFNSDGAVKDLDRASVAVSILDKVGIDDINRLIACDVTEEAILDRLQITRGDFNIWIMSDGDRQMKYMQSHDLMLFQKVQRAKKSSLDVTALDPDEARALKLRLEAAKYIDSKLRDINPEKKAGTVVSINILGGMVQANVNNA